VQLVDFYEVILVLSVQLLFSVLLQKVPLQAVLVEALVLALQRL